MKDPVGILGCRRGFSLPEIRFPESWFDVDPKPVAAARGFRKGAVMPPWMEILLNVLGYAGFVGIAVFHKPSKKNVGDRGAQDT